MMRKYWFSGLLLLTALSQPLFAKDNRPFDYYVLSLSWSPEFCIDHPKENQCGKGYGVVLHGLWPQYWTGYPESCSAEKMPRELVQNYAGLYPSPKLAFHEWEKHGTCSGLSPRDYLKYSEQLKQSFVEPPALRNLTRPLRITANELRKQIVYANPRLNRDAVLLSCSGSGRFLREIYLCFDKSGSNPVACSTDMVRRSQRSCGKADFLIRSER